MSLLEKVRHISPVIYKCWLKEENFRPLCYSLSKYLQAHVYLIDLEGEVESCYLMKEAAICCWQREKNHCLKRELLKKINTLKESKMQVTNACPFQENVDCISKNNLIFVPINCADERLGTLVLKNAKRNFLEEDIVLAECVATLIGMEILRHKDYKRKKVSSLLSVAWKTLSHSEKKAVKGILEELPERKGIIVARQVAKKEGVGTGIIVSALKKLMGARVLETKSLGVKGTYINILDEKIFQKIDI